SAADMVDRFHHRRSSACTSPCGRNALAILEPYRSAGWGAAGTQAHNVAAGLRALDRHDDALAWWEAALAIEDQEPHRWDYGFRLTLALAAETCVTLGRYEEAEALLRHEQALRAPLDLPGGRPERTLADA